MIKFCPLPIIISSILGIICLDARAQFDLSKLEYYIAHEKSVPKTSPNSPNYKIGAILERELQDFSANKSLNDNQISIAIRTQYGQASNLAKQLSQKGYLVQHQEGDNVYVVVPYHDVESLAMQENIKSIDAQDRITVTDDIANLFSQIGLGDQVHIEGSESIIDGNTQNSIIRDRNDIGLKVMRVDLLHQKGWYGQGVKIGIIDFGYNSYDLLQTKGIVPRPVSKATFDLGKQSNSLSTSGGSTSHGSAVAEIIYNIAPKSTYYIAQVGDGYGSATDGDILKAIKWLSDQGVNIINFSGGGHLGPKDGTDIKSRLIDQLSQKGILWVNSSGNEGFGEHWSGPIVDSDGDNLIDFNDKDYLRFNVYDSQKPFRLLYTWDDWNDEIGLDLDAYIYDPKIEDVIVKHEEERKPNTDPVDGMRVSLPRGEYYLILSFNKKPNNKKVHVSLGGHAELIDYRSTGSVGIPATAKSALAVGAWDVNQKKLASYSSWGPTDDNRIKPELIAPAGAPSISYQGKPFDGTSASAPYATAFAALLWSGNRSSSANSIKNMMIQKYTKQLEKQRPTYATGYGILNASQSSSTQRQADQIEPEVNQSPNSVQDLLNNLGIF